MTAALAVVWVLLGVPVALAVLLAMVVGMLGGMLFIAIWWEVVIAFIYVASCRVGAWFQRWLP